MASLFSKPNTIVYIRRSGLIVAGQQIKPARLNFPSKVVTNLEVVQPRKFIAGCQAFFNDNRLKGKRVLMVLDQELVFEKNTAVTSKVQATTEAEAFIQAMPHAVGERSCLELLSGDQLELFATNHYLYECLVQALELAGVSKIVAITPASAYRLPDDQKLSASIEQFMNDTKVRSAANFANIQPV